MLALLQKAALLYYVLNTGKEEENNTNFIRNFLVFFLFPLLRLGI